LAKQEDPDVGNELSYEQKKEVKQGFKHGAHLNNIQKFSPYLTGNTLMSPL
jgi:hypothetical protein